ncbi:uncharacterized protein LOC135145272 isoform X1 [Zophobas morio]|uniref:uncharacterized protein LOC135145272 isoform X1 n=1 Tax=Zophobas morio TaxID=2755281 RepID=UPI003083E05C
MTLSDKHFIVRLQLLQLIYANSFIEDYYYIKYTSTACQDGSSPRSSNPSRLDVIIKGFPCPSFKKATAICVRSARSKRAPLKTKNLLLIIERCYELLLSVEEFGVLCRYYKNLFADLFSRANRYMSPFWNFPSWNSTWSQ